MSSNFVEKLLEERIQAHKERRRALGTDNFEQNYLQAQNDNILKNLNSLRDFYDRRIQPLGMERMIQTYRENYGNLAELEINDKLSKMYMLMIKNLIRQLKKQIYINDLPHFLDSIEDSFTKEYQDYFVSWNQPHSTSKKRRR